MNYLIGFTFLIYGLNLTIANYGSISNISLLTEALFLCTDTYSELDRMLLPIIFCLLPPLFKAEN